MNEWAELDRALEVMAASGHAEVREDGEWLAELAGLHCELRSQGKNSLVHLWSDERSVTRRVLRVREQSEDRIILEVQRFGRAKTGRMEFLRTDTPRSAARITREMFRARFHRILSERFPDARIDPLTTSPDLHRSFSSWYARGSMREADRSYAVMALAPGESAAALESMLAFGILWLDWVRSRAERQPIEGLRLFIPEGSAKLLRERTAGLSSAARTQIFAYRDSDWRMQKLDTADSGNLESWLVPRRESEAALRSAQQAGRRISTLARAMGDSAGAVRLHVLAAAKEVAFCFRGLEFARWSKEGMKFGIGDSQEYLTTAKEPALERLIVKLDLHRGALAGETNHRLYRAAPERWLETLVLDDCTRLDAQLDPQHLYSQVPALAGGNRGILDLLGVTRSGRLVVIELKASEDLQLPLQAIDYWLRVRRHQREGDFDRYGYFPGIVLDARPPLVWLAAPALRFHPATDTLLKYLSPEFCVTRIGLNESWRRGLKVMFRQ
ncbi:MAG TPA: hypothetical protein VNK23_16285 [Candidatus Dormibacteraeota bacterium]|nr:hypothetical protein [Candidatus Dormibacteraeota bacterium]